MKPHPTSDQILVKLVNGNRNEKSIDVLKREKIDIKNLFFTQMIKEKQHKMTNIQFLMKLFYDFFKLFNYK